VYIYAATGEAVPDTSYQFDYKTGVLEFINNTGYAKSKALYISAYQYVGRTLASDATTGYSGSFSGSFQGSATLNNLTLTGSFNHTGSYSLTGSINVQGAIISNGINVVDNAIAMAIALG
jgi:hypothetical protein